MKESWWSKNSKWVSPAIAIITFVGGLLLGYFRAVDKYESKLEVMQLRLEDKIDDAKKDIEDLIQQRILTDFATKIKWEIKKELTEGE